jgi:hypothetical protein
MQIKKIISHTPDCIMKTDGVSHDVSERDETLARKYPDLRNWVIGCDAIARFSKRSSVYFDVQSEPLSITCNSIN